MAKKNESEPIKTNPDENKPVETNPNEFMTESKHKIPLFIVGRRCEDLLTAKSDKIVSYRITGDFLEIVTVEKVVLE